jgi:hypothetical protein
VKGYVAQHFRPQSIAETDILKSDHVMRLKSAVLQSKAIKPALTLAIDESEGTKLRQSGLVMPSNLAVSDNVVICCPACGASEAADTAIFSNDPMIVCRECGETWRSPPRRPKRLAASQTEQRRRAAPEFMDAERRPLVTYSGGTDAAWAAKIRSDALPERQRRLPVALSAGAIASVFFIAVFLGGREAAVTVLPDLAGLYAAIGLPVNLDGLAIEGVEAERAPAAEGTRLTVRGTIRNTGSVAQAVPALTASLYDGAKAPVGVRGFDPPPRMIRPGEAAPFMLALDRVPEAATEVVVRLRRPAGQAASGREAVATQ